jgi:cell division protein FtsX
MLLPLASGCGEMREAAPKECVLHVYFGHSATRAEMKRAETRLRDRDDVYSVRFVSKQEALQIMRERFPAETENLMANPFPDALTVRPVKGASLEQIAADVRSGRDAVKLPRPAECSG